jgi:hypothetical protein
MPGNEVADERTLWRTAALFAIFENIAQLDSPILKSASPFNSTVGQEMDVLGVRASPSSTTATRIGSRSRYGLFQRQVGQRGWAAARPHVGAHGGGT